MNDINNTTNTENTEIFENDGKLPIPETPPEVTESPEDPSYVADQDPNKLFIKTIDGSRIIKNRNQIIIDNGEFQFMNPNDTLLFEDGWEEYIVPVPQPPVETVESAKSKAIRRINMYDSSSSVNEFYVSDMPIWLDKATRVGLKLRFESEMAMGMTTTSLWYEDHKFELETENAIKMLFAIELYASACYDNTQNHIANVKALETIEEIEQYDYTTGYPEKLRF